MTTTSARTPVLLDCDTGVDDAMALLYLLSRPDIELVGVTTVFGNNTAAQAAINNCRIIEMTGHAGIPVAVGTERPLVGEPTYLATHVHGPQGLGSVVFTNEIATRPVEESAVELLDRLSGEYAGRLRILATAPLTNLALALTQVPELVDRIVDVTIMGGAADAPGNQTPAAEANIVHDPEAAQQVIDAAWATTLVPLDVTMTELLTEDHRTRLAASKNPGARLIAEITDFYFGVFGEHSFGYRCSPCHDALAAGILTGEVQPRVFPVIDVQIDCTDGPGRGATICDTRSQYRKWDPPPKGNCRVALVTDGTFPDKLVDALTARPDRGTA